MILLYLAISLLHLTTMLLALICMAIADEYLGEFAWAHFN